MKIMKLIHFRLTCTAIKPPLTAIAYPDAYITEDFRKAIQNERKVLIKAILKARENDGLSNAKVVSLIMKNMIVEISQTT